MRVAAAATTEKKSIVMEFLMVKVTRMRSNSSKNEDEGVFC